MLNGSVVKKWIYKDQLNPLAELDSLGNVASLFAPGYIKKNDSIYALITDHLGSVQILIVILILSFISKRFRKFILRIIKNLKEPFLGP